MPTTVFPDSSLSFKSVQNVGLQSRPDLGLYLHQTQQRTGQQHGAAAQFYSSFAGNASSPEAYSSDSTESSGVHENSTSPLRSPDTTVYEDVNRSATGKSGPYLAMVEEPTDKFRFRYITEMQGPHGAIMGEKSGARKKAKTWPTVKLYKYAWGPATREVVIRCTLSTTHENLEERIPHVHRLVCKTVGEEDDPVDVRISSPQYTAEFKNMTIIYTKKPDQVEELIKKKSRHKSKYLVRPWSPSTDADFYIEEEIKEEIKEKITKPILNQACLKFEALADNGKGYYEQICPPIFSRPISNMKSSDFGDLKICKQSAWRGSCTGGDMVFIFVDRVQKDNIKVKFFETDDNDEITWEDYAEFTPQDVHHQFGIVFRTPPYKDLNITENKSVRFQLYRPTDQGVSEAHEWEYKPDPKSLHKDPKRKKPLGRQMTPTFDQRPMFSPPIPTVVPQRTPTPQSTPIVDSDWESFLMDLASDLPDLNLTDVNNVIGPDTMETQANLSITSSTPSLDDILNRLLTPDEEQTKAHIKDFISFDRFEEWARCNNQHEPAQQIISERTVSSTGNTLDGVAWWRAPRLAEWTLSAEPQMEGAVKMEVIDEDRHHATHQMETGGHRATATHQMAMATHQMDTGGHRLTATHQSANAQLNSGEFEADHQSYPAGYVPESALSGLRQLGKTYESPRQRLARRQERVPGGKSSSVGGFKPEMGLPVVLPLPEESNNGYIRSAERLAAKLNRLKVAGKFNDQHMRIALNKLFTYTMGENEDSLFHVMVERYSRPCRTTQMFLNLVKEYGLEEVLNQKNGSGEAPLHTAVRAGKVEIVVKLLESGADVNVKDDENNSPLQLAVTNCQEDIVQALMLKNPDLSVINENGCSVLHVAAIKESVAIMSCLLIKIEGATRTYDLMNQKDKKLGNTALHMVVAHRFIDGIQLLLSFQNCDVNALNYSGVTPLGLVLESRFGIDQEIAYILMRHKADRSMVKLTKEKLEVKDLEDDDDGDNLEIDEGDDVEDEERYKREWSKESELFDYTVVAKLCPILDRCNGWKQLLPRLNFSDLETEQIGKYWSPSLLAFNLISSHKPEITVDKIRAAILKMPREEYAEAIRLIDNYMLTKLGL